ncbi:hypothetical protein NDU88_005422 [Pleurodeles waltl]|uniref:Uncharacterized protein n=1 Tax=Pleurodeles waltl TaxID=8319 RepID=A0AAV7TUS8_PLEWA|nr:hypothetical protein NDU88_005422 [Pleurodeles waltl]
MVVGVVSARERCVVMGVMVMEVVAEDVVHSGVNGDETEREEEDVDEGDTVEAVDVAGGLVAAVEPVDSEEEEAEEEDILQHPYNGDQGGVDVLEFLPDPQIVFLLQPLGLLKVGQYRCHRLLGTMRGDVYRRWNTAVERPPRGFVGRDSVGVFLLA